MKLYESLFSANYPGGNILVEKMEGDRVWLSPDFRHMQEGQKWFYWSFRAQNEKPLTVIFSHKNYVGAHGFAISRDGGLSWKWLGRDGVCENPISEHLIEFAFEIPPTPREADVRYAFCPQYQQSDWERWLQNHGDHPALEVSVLCESRRGRGVEMLRIREGEPQKIIWLMARNHACEAAASYVLEGMLETVLGDDAVGKQLRANWEFIATPFMDKDGVEEGDQGKLRHPHDHNRDYTDKPIYPEVAAAMRFGETHKNDIMAFFDIHCPMVHGPWDNRFYLVGNQSPQVADRQVAFMKVFKAHRTGSVDCHHGGVLPYGEAWNTAANFSQGENAADWAAQTFRDARIVASFEIPYANSEGIEMNPESERSLGRDLAVALLHH